MDPHSLLTADHQALRKHAASLKTLLGGDPKKLTEALQAFQKAVQKHFQSEDVYYRILDTDKRVQDRALIHQLRNDHAAVVFTLESLLIRLRKSGVTEDWRNRFDNLMNVFLPHLDHEDNILFPTGKKILTPQEIELISRQIQSSE